MHRCLIFDADDTLWENNIYFQRAIEEFLAVMKPIAAEGYEYTYVIMPMRL